jgi:hypothetical protein
MAVQNQNQDLHEVGEKILGHIKLVPPNKRKKPDPPDPPHSQAKNPSPTK